MADIDRYSSAGQIVSEVLGILGLPVPVSVASSSDATARQMWRLLTECGQKLTRVNHTWQMQYRTWEINTTGATEYDLPSDLARFVDETGWNNTSRIPMLGPMSQQQWRMLQARKLGGTTLRVQYIIQNDKLVLYFAPTPTQNLTIEYISRGWVSPAAAVDTRLDHVMADADTVLYPPELIKAFLKYKWREEKGFDTTASKQDYDDMLEQCKYDDRPHRRLSLVTQGAYPYVGVVNLPDTGIGGG